MGRGRRAIRRAVVPAALVGAMGVAGQAVAQTPDPSVKDPALEVRAVVSGLESPIGVAFLGEDDFLALEKATGRVKRVQDGAVRATVLDLPVNSASERGLLSIALHPRFHQNGWVYLFWSESLSGADSTDLADVPVRGNRIDRFTWDGSTLTFDRTIRRFRAFQSDEGQPLRGNHNGGPLRFGPDGKLYVIVGDTGRRGQMQNLVDGPFGEGLDDDQFGGPDPDNDHLTGSILRLNDDGTAPRDNPFYSEGAERGGQVGANLKRLYAYGIRNSFGLTFDPYSGHLWEQENGDDSFSEINRVEPGFNSGWTQIMGPAERVAQFRAIETDTRTGIDPNAPNGYFGLQQIRWSPENIARTPEEALSRLFKLPGSRFSDPEMAWKFEVAPGGIAFLEGDGLGHRYDGDFFVGSARAALASGNLFRLEVSGSRRSFDLDDRRLRDRVADNAAKYDVTESESLLFGENFGVTPDVQTSPDETLYVVSLSRNTVYEIRRR
jgi:glucose/arabinose dehydrogenase